MATAPEPPLDELLWTIAAARLILPAGDRRAGAAEPDRRLRAHCSTPGSTTGAASRRSRSTTSTRRRRGPSSSGCARPRSRAASSSRRGCTVYPRFLDGEWLDPARAAAARSAPSDSLGLAREDAWAPGEAGRRCRSSSAATRCRSTRATSSARTRSRASSARAARNAQRVLAAADALRREVSGDVVTLRRHAEHPVHERLLLPLRLLRVLERQARAQPPRRALPRPARGDRPPSRRGVGARRDGDLPPGRHPPGFRRRLLRLGRPRDQGRGARVARARVQRAGGLAGRGDARAPAARLPRAPARRGARARCRARRPRCSTTRCAR